ncbi:carboxylesterase family protein-like protein [Aureobasidium subglaciale]|nr:carboxylesterase family protein-like protein [Aureobasidium subglaciale]
MFRIVKTTQLALTLWIAGIASAQNTTLPIVDLSPSMTFLEHPLRRAPYFSATLCISPGKIIRADRHCNLQEIDRIHEVPAVNHSIVQKGDVGRICAQGSPNWFNAALAIVPDLLSGNSSAINVTETAQNLDDLNVQTMATLTRNATALLANQDPRVSEDCLFLDVISPRKVFSQVGKAYGSPVLVNIHGGGYATGSKADVDPISLMNQAKADGEEFVYVAINYRLGALGWLGGPRLQASGGTANAGLHDQRLALRWVRENIHLFGGDPNRVTIMGTSAGASSVLHQITAFGGKRDTGLFAQGIVESPGFQPMPSSIEQQKIHDKYMSYLNVTSLAEAREVSSEAALLANYLALALAPYGSLIYGPVPDGDIVPAIPGQLLANGLYDTTVKSLMTGHTLNEGLGFVDPAVQNNTAFMDQVIGYSPALSSYPEMLSYITETLYPPIFNGTEAQSYTTQLLRAAAFNSELSYTCNCYYLNKAFANSSYGYEFAVLPSLHAESSGSIFYQGDQLAQNAAVFIDWTSTLSSAQIAYAMQSYVSRFITSGNPNKEGVAAFDVYGEDSSSLIINTTGIVNGRASTANERCVFWQEGLFF